jgi:hypothetical protein
VANVRSSFIKLDDLDRVMTEAENFFTLKAEE